MRRVENESVRPESEWERGFQRMSLQPFLALPFYTFLFLGKIPHFGRPFSEWGAESPRLRARGMDHFRDVVDAPDSSLSGEGRKDRRRRRNGGIVEINEER